MSWSYENTFCVQNKNNGYIRVSLCHAFTRVPWSLHLVLLIQECSDAEPGSHCALFTSKRRCILYINQSSWTCLNIFTERLTCNFLPSLTYFNQNIMNYESWMFYVRMPAPASAAPHTCIVNARQRLTQKRRDWWIKSYICFCAQKAFL